MKYTAPQPFAKHIREAAPSHFSCLYFIICKEGYVRTESVNLLKQNLKGEWTVLEGKGLTPQQLSNEVNAYSFFTSNKIIHIRSLHELSKATQQQLEVFLQKPLKNLTIVLSGESCNRATKFYKNVEKLGVVLDIPEEKSWEKENSIQQWLFNYAASKGVKMPHECARLLVQQMGTDKENLSSELEKLITFLGERKEITIDDVTTICDVVNLQNIWQLGDALLQRNGADAVKIAKGLMQDGLPFFVLMKQIRTQLQTKFQVCSILASGGTQGDVTALFPYMRGRILEQNCNLAKSFGMERFRRAMLTLGEIELMAKSQSGEDSWLLLRLILKLVK